MRAVLALLLVIGICFTSMARASETQAKVLFILDGSGSMWGRIDNQPKISIAKQLMSGLIRELPDSVAAGLQVYGHRSKGDCNDIELVAPLGRDDRNTLIQHIESINPKGKTPITGALTLAGESLREFEDETTVVLISDGKETCDADPCALVRELRDSGIKLQIHVVGFDVNRDEREQLVCIAEAGGGEYFSADNTEQLQQALTEVKQQVVEKVEKIETTPEAPPAPAPTLSTLIAINANTGEPVTDAVEWTLINTETEEILSFNSPGAELQEALPAGHYEIFASAGSIDGDAQLSLDRPLEQPFIVQLGVAGEPKVFDAPASIAAGERLVFNWNGPNAEGDMIFIAKPDMPENKYYLSNEQRHLTKQGQPAELTAPAQPGSYEIRYYSYNNGAVLSRADLEVTDHQVAIDTPATVPAGQIFNFTWKGPDAPGDMIFVAEPSMADNRYWTSNKQRHLTKNGVQGQLIAPAKPDSYEIRYYSRNNATVLARFELEVSTAAVTLDAPRRVSVGSEIKVDWTGPNAPGDLIFITEPNLAENRYYYSGRRSHATKKGTPAQLTVPAKAGTYEIRYYSKNNGKVLAKRALIVR